MTKVMISSQFQTNHSSAYLPLTYRELVKRCKIENLLGAVNEMIADWLAAIFPLLTVFGFPAF